MSVPQWQSVTEAELDDFLALTLLQRGERLCAMTPTRWIAYRVAYARLSERDFDDVDRLFRTWRSNYLDSLNERRC